MEELNKEITKENLKKCEEIEELMKWREYLIKTGQMNDEKLMMFNEELLNRACKNINPEFEAKEQNSK